MRQMTQKAHCTISSYEKWLLERRAHNNQTVEDAELAIMHNQLLWPVSDLGFAYCEVDRLQEGQDILEQYLKMQADAFGIDDTLSFR